VVLGVFIALHLINHVAGIFGQDTHRAVQNALRHIYRGWAEPALLLACAIPPIARFAQKA
jgi:hypothetical protein